MQLMIVDNIYAQRQCIDDNFTEDEIKDAYNVLNNNLTTFYRMDDIGYIARNNAIEIWKNNLIENGQYIKSNINSIEQQLIAADLNSDFEIKTAILMNKNMSNNKE